MHLAHAYSGPPALAILSVAGSGSSLPQIAPHPIAFEPNPVAHTVLDGYLLETQPLKYRPTEQACLGGPVAV